MQKQRADHSSKASLFLLELIFSILFFSVASAVCMQLFARAHLQSKAGANLTMAVNCAQSAAECFQSTAGAPTELAALLAATTTAPGQLTACYNRLWQPCKPQEAVYCLRLQLEQGSALAQAHVVVTKAEDQALLYELTTKKYLSPTRSGTKEVAFVE